MNIAATAVSRWMRRWLVALALPLLAIALLAAATLGQGQTAPWLDLSFGELSFGGIVDAFVNGTTMPDGADFRAYPESVLLTCALVARRVPATPRGHRSRGDRPVNGRVRVALNLRRLRRKQGLSQESLAELAGIHRTYVGSVERGERNVSIDNICRLASGLGVDAGELLAPAAGTLSEQLTRSTARGRGATHGL